MYRKAGLLRWMLIGSCVLAAACAGADDEANATTAAEATAAPSDETTTTGDEATTTAPGTLATTVEEPEPEPEPEPAPDPEPECSFLTCDTDVPPGVEGTIGTLIPGPPCSGGEAPVIVPEDAEQGDMLYICVPSLVTRLAPYTVTIIGPGNVVVFDETRETPVGIPPIAVAATPAGFPIGNYRVTVMQVQDFVIDATTEFSIERATSPRVLVEERSSSMIRLWVAGAAPNANAEVDFYLLAAGQECTYQGTETIAINGTGIGFGDFEVAGLRSGAYYAFLRSETARRCIREDFRVS